MPDAPAADGRIANVDLADAVALFPVVLPALAPRA